MNSDPRERSPKGDRDRFPNTGHREWQGDREGDHGHNLHERPRNEGYYNRSRHEYSRSPAAPAGGRSELNYDDVPEEDHASSRRGYGEGVENGDGRGGRRDFDHGLHGRRYDDQGHSRRDYRRRRSVSYSDGDRDGRGRSYSPPEHSQHPGQPSNTVMLEGLPADIPTNELQSMLFMSEVLAPLGLVDIRVPQSGGNRRAFLQFRNVDEAADFVDSTFPEVRLELGGRQERLYLHYARSREDDRRTMAATSDQWTCPSCDFSNYSTRTRCKSCGYIQGSSNSYRPHLTGESDAANEVSHFIVVYPLDAQVTEEMLEYGIKKLEKVEKPQPRDGETTSRPLKSTAPTGDTTGYGARRGSLHRVFLVRDRASGQSFKYGFGEFWTFEDAVAALTKYRISKNFTIGGHAVTVSAIHMGVFVPELNEPTPATDKYSFVPLFNPALRVKYWHDHVYPSPRLINTEPPAGLEGGGDSTQKAAEEKRCKKRKAEATIGSAPKKPVAMAPQMAMWQKKHNEIHGAGKGLQDASENQGSDSEARGSAAGKLEKQGPIKISLGGMAKAAAVASGPPPASGPLPPASTGKDQSSSAQSTPTVASAPVSYVDRDRVCCLICMMKYKSPEDLDIHERSSNHKKAMADDDKVKASLPRLAARDKRMEKTKKQDQTTTASESSPPPPASQYRDRAKERRSAFKQPHRPTGQPNSAGEDELTPNQQQQQQASSKESKGSAMLAKMGWAAGRGLGAQGSGRTDIVETNAYQEGVGLGVEGGNLGDAAKRAERRTVGGYQGYVNEAQEKARARYNQMG